MRPASDSADLDIFPRRVLQVHDPGAAAGGSDGCTWDREGVAVPGVPALGQVTGELQVLALVIAHGDEVGVVEQDVGGHEGRVDEEANPGPKLFATFGRLVLPLGHPVQLAHAGGALEQPGQFGVLVDVALDEQDATRRVKPGRKQQGGHRQSGLGQLFRVAGDGQGMQVDDAVKGVVAVLEINPPAQCPQVVAAWGAPVGCIPENTVLVALAVPTTTQGTPLVACVAGH